MDIIPQDTPQKQCSKCPNSYPATPEFFSRKGKRLRSECKSCQKAESKAYYTAHIEERKQYWQEHQEEKKAYQKHRYREQKEEHNEKSRQYYSTHKEAICTYQQQYNQEHQEHRRQRGERYRAKHEEHIREQKAAYSATHREEIQEQGRAYRKTEQGQRVGKAHQHRRRAQKKAILGTLTAQQIQEKLKAQKHKCYYCFAKFEKVKGCYVYHLEHTIPISRTEHNPRHDMNYVVLSCPHCNLSKNNKLPHEWSKGGRLF